MASSDREEANWFVDGVTDALEAVYQTGKNLTTCETPGHTFGLKVSWGKVSITECGCYDSAVWPLALTFGASGVKTLGKEAVDQIVAYSRKKLAKKLAKQRTFETLTVFLPKQINDYATQHTYVLAKLRSLKAPGFAENVKPLFDNVNSKIDKLMKSLKEVKDSPELLFSSKSFRDKHFYSGLEGLSTQISELAKLKEELVAYVKEYKKTFLRQPGTSNTAQKLIDTWEDFEDEVQFLYETAQQAAIPETVSTLTYGLGFLSFISGILAYLTVVVDKECAPLIVDENYKNQYEGPFDPKFPSDLRDRVIQNIDAIYFGGQWQGSSWDGSIFFPSFKNDKGCKTDPSISQDLGSSPSWQKIREVLISKKMPVWPTQDASCACVECPGGYKLCSYSSIINGYSDIYNICIPACGGQDIIPVDARAIALKANCELECPEGYTWVNCVNSDCDRSPCKDGSDKGFCVATPELNKFPVYSDNRTGTITIDPKYGKMVWDSITCRWVCKNYIDVQETVDGDGNITIVTPNNWEPKYTGGLNNRLINPFTPNKTIDLSECPDGYIRTPEEDCLCEPISSGSYDSGIPELPEGYILFDNQVLLIGDDLPSDYSGDDDIPDPGCSSIDNLKEENPNSSLGEIIGGIVTISSLMLTCFQIQEHMIPRPDEQEEDHCKDLTPSQQTKLETLIRISDESYYTKTWGHVGHGLQPVITNESERIAYEAKILERYRKKIKQFLCLVLQMKTEKDYNDFLKMTTQGKEQVMKMGLIDRDDDIRDGGSLDRIKSEIRRSENYQWMLFMQNMVLASRSLVNNIPE